MTSTDFENYKSRTVKLFNPVDNSIAIGEIETAMVRDIVKECKVTTFAKVLTRLSTHMADNDIKSLIDPDIPTTTNRTASDNMKLLINGYSQSINKINHMFNSANSSLTYLKSQKSQFNNLNIDIEAELDTLNNLIPFHMLGKISSWRLPTFTLHSDSVSDIKIDHLYLSFDFSKEHYQQGILVYADNDFALYETKRKQYYHPHVNREGNVCWGDGDGAASNLWREKKLVPLTQLLINILSSYNSNSPYVDLKYWKRIKYYQCNNCNEDVSETSVRFINNDKDIPACSSCSILFNKTYNWKHDFVYSDINLKYIPKINATKALTSSGAWDYIEDILTKPEYTSCPKCFAMVHHSRILNHKNGICSYCAEKEEVEAGGDTEDSRRRKKSIKRIVSKNKGLSAFLD